MLQQNIQLIKRQQEEIESEQAGMAEATNLSALSLQQDERLFNEILSKQK